MALERLGPVWHRLGFNQKYIIRNTLRNKVRMATCIFGIAFCMALVFLAFALRDSIQPTRTRWPSGRTATTSWWI